MCWSMTEGDRWNGIQGKGGGTVQSHQMKSCCVIVDVVSHSVFQTSATNLKPSNVIWCLFISKLYFMLFAHAQWWLTFSLTNKLEDVVRVYPWTIFVLFVCVEYRTLHGCCSRFSFCDDVDSLKARFPYYYRYDTCTYAIIAFVLINAILLSRLFAPVRLRLLALHWMQGRSTSWLADSVFYGHRTSAPDQKLKNHSPSHAYWNTVYYD